MIKVTLSSWMDEMMIGNLPNHPKIGNMCCLRSIPTLQLYYFDIVL